MDMEWPIIVSDERGQPLIFDSKEAAQKEADGCHRGIVVAI